MMTSTSQPRVARNRAPASIVILDGVDAPLTSDSQAFLISVLTAGQLLDSSRDHTKRSSITADRLWRAHENWALSLCKDAFGNTKTDRVLRVTSDHDQIDVALSRGL